MYEKMDSIFWIILMGHAVEELRQKRGRLLDKNSQADDGKRLEPCHVKKRTKHRD